MFSSKQLLPQFIGTIQENKCVTLKRQKIDKWHTQFYNKKTSYMRISSLVPEGRLMRISFSRKMIGYLILMVFNQIF